MLSVNRVDPTKSRVSSTAPRTVGCQGRTGRDGPEGEDAHHWACSKKKFGCRE